MIEQDIKYSISNNIVKNLLNIHLCQRCKNKANIPILDDGDDFNITKIRRISCNCYNDYLIKSHRYFLEIISGYSDKGLFYTLYNSIDMPKNKNISYRLDYYSDITCVSFYNESAGRINAIKFENNSNDLILYSNEDILNLYENLIFS